MADLIMYVALGLVGYLLYRGLNHKPIIPLRKRAKKQKNKRELAINTREIKGPFNELLGIKTVHGNLFELKTEQKDVRVFVGAVQCEPINYALRSNDEQADTDNAYEHLFASLSLGPGREVHVATHVHSRPIELVDQMKVYYNNFQNLDPVAQRYAQTMFFPFMETWQKGVEEFDYGRYFLVTLDYSNKMIGDMDEDSILVKVRNEFGRLASNIISNYGRMGGIAEICQQRDLYEALYFATHKKSASIEHFRSLFDRENPLSPFVMSDYSRKGYRYLEEEENESDEDKVAI
ncbi:hypothetical protein [Cohnella sp. AR92]|uniref:hypothetical protein n=1 Tax=Cohnella sp. AR92 TaxID=648716 RepID=UPI000F8D5C59|nr:hypothetical protein [Cohnella sp. AR92]RUS44982.1 hypothetical protein ELR57_22265 [Cohnella sp. AR92]